MDVIASFSRIKWYDGHSMSQHLGNYLSNPRAIDLAPPRVRAKMAHNLTSHDGGNLSLRIKVVDGSSIWTFLYCVNYVELDANEAISLLSSLLSDPLTVSASLPRFLLFAPPRVPRSRSVPRLDEGEKRIEWRLRAVTIRIGSLCCWEPRGRRGSHPRRESNRTGRGWESDRSGGAPDTGRLRPSSGSSLRSRARPCSGSWRRRTWTASLCRKEIEDRRTCSTPISSR
jgi:hypothetical protein